MRKVAKNRLLNIEIRFRAGHIDAERVKRIVLHHNERLKGVEPPRQVSLSEVMRLLIDREMTRILQLEQQEKKDGGSKDGSNPEGVS